MQNILIIGAGRSSIYLIQYLIQQRIENNWRIKIADMSVQLVQEKIGGTDLPNVEAVAISIEDEKERMQLITWADIVISIMPPVFHDVIADDCLRLKKHLFTASYVSKHIQDMKNDIAANNLFFMCEMGLDPGIDHVSALHCIDNIHRENGKILSFKSYCGGLVAPESDNNPWHYKISWNPRNVVLAGKGTALYYKNNKVSLIPYHRIFTQIESLQVPEMGLWEGYANRNSLSYRSLYKLDDVPDFIRGTIRHKGFCESWNALVQLGFTDENCIIENASNLSFKQITAALIGLQNEENVESEVSKILQINVDGKIMQNLRWLGIFSDNLIGKNNVSLADILQLLLEEKWKLSPQDKDMVILQHEFIYLQNNVKKKLISYLVDIGLDSKKTSMAKLVGLPLALSVEAFIQGAFGNISGVHIPSGEAIYPIMMEKLKANGIIFKELISDL